MFRRIYKTIWEMSKKYLYFSLILIIIKSILPIITVIFPKIVIDNITSGKGFKVVVSTIIFIIFIKYLLEILVNIFDNKLEYIGTELNQKFELNILKKIMRVDYEILESPKILDMKDKALEGISVNNGSISIYNEKIIEIISSIISIFGVTYIITRINIRYLLALVLILILDFVIEKLIANFEIKNWNKWIPINRKFRMVYDLMYNFNNGSDIRIFNTSDFFGNTAKDTNKDMYQVMSDEAKTVSKYNILNNLLESLKIFLVFYLGLEGLTKKSLSIADFSSYLVSVNVFLNSVKTISHAIVDISKINCYVESYFVFLDLDISEKEIIIKNKNILNLDKKGSKIVFENVYFKYPSQDKYTLKNLSFKIGKNERVSLVGSNGAGKSTIIKLLIGLYKPTEGRILIDGCDLESYKKEDLFKKFGVAFQDFNIFPLSVSENIDTNYKCDEEKINELLSEFGLYEKIESLEHGLEENLYKAYDSSSTDLSLGQKQKITLIRALYSDREFLILDEPTASVDVYTEVDFYKSLEEFTRNKTSIFISHRLISSKFSDKIFVLENGEIIESGSFEDLMRENSRFKEMFDIQKKKFV
ncbi:MULTISPECIES: ABC transporter ATP-binding protein [Peptoniphilus]|uniref:ABC transporter ATP-binding protein n=6 Tax=Peptoniphilaceae TaxID=1570339 RepID=UPI00258BB1CB|nr:MULTISPECIES: ABC transporter ATP-binding protein [Peptoniphilus]MDU1042833.1 ABC transporter ATP-binding protein [Peptoniphilus rhinitidis]MDU1955390.1 ABC transporter ATP-binding protein [Peptoniphilus lacydonensis]MDU2115006.1 ABC transporter ATP-binding protein [Peptoniphilus lacydonensis]MDU7302658.1 ABC transporter ATP-binding protein [Peptoniphilus lacydonensis]